MRYSQVADSPLSSRAKFWMEYHLIAIEKQGLKVAYKLSIKIHGRDLGMVFNSSTLGKLF